jgi:hypothetical protein
MCPLVPMTSPVVKLMKMGGLGRFETCPNPLLVAGWGRFETCPNLLLILAL